MESLPSGNAGLARFLPKLRMYDGLTALKHALRNSRIPSSNSAAIAFVLYQKLGLV